MQFEGFQKIGRLSKKAVVTEKIDGTNGQIKIVKAEFASDGSTDNAYDKAVARSEDGAWFMFAGSRNRWLVPGDDNFAFAAWVKANANELFKLGEGSHFGEWWGRGIGRNYGLDHKRFSLFNTARWGAHNPNTPSCCYVVPVLRICTLDEVDDVMVQLKAEGSRAAPGFKDPEGVVVYYERQLFKKTFEYDQGKWTGVK